MHHLACVSDDCGGLEVSCLQLSSSSSVKLLSMKSTCSTSPFTTDQGKEKKEERKRKRSSTLNMYAQRAFLFLQRVRCLVPLGVSSSMFLSSSSLCCSREISVNRKDLSEKSSADWNETDRMFPCAHGARQKTDLHSTEICLIGFILLPLTSFPDHLLLPLSTLLKPESRPPY